MSHFKIEMFTTRSLVSNDCAEKVYQILSSWDFPPDVFSEYEPVRQKWSMKDTFIAAWNQQGRQFLGQILIRRKCRLAYNAEILFQFGPNRKQDNRPPYHCISVYRVKESHCTRASREKLVSLGDRFFTELEMDYGYICLSNEYESKNILKNVPHADGTIEPRKVIGMNWPQCIPGLYWINYFGRSYLEQGFAKRAFDSYSSNMTRVGSGIRFKTNDEPRFFESAGGAAAEREMRDALGEKWFFDQGVNRECLSIDVSLDQLRSP